MTIENYKNEYNKLLDRFNKANEYFERKDISNQEKEKYLDNYMKILEGLNYYLSKIGIYSNQNILGGFQMWGIKIY